MPLRSAFIFGLISIGEREDGPLDHNTAQLVPQQLKRQIQLAVYSVLNFVGRNHRVKIKPLVETLRLPNVPSAIRANDRARTLTSNRS